MTSHLYPVGFAHVLRLRPSFPVTNAIKWTFHSEITTRMRESKFKFRSVIKARFTNKMAQIFIAEHLRIFEDLLTLQLRKIVPA